jgi:hypothetical protein
MADTPSDRIVNRTEDGWLISAEQCPTADVCGTLPPDDGLNVLVSLLEAPVEVFMHATDDDCPVCYGDAGDWCERPEAGRSVGRWWYVESTVAAIEQACRPGGVTYTVPVGGGDHG